MVLRGRPPKAAKITRVCVQCGNSWLAYSWDQKNKYKYCSRRCFGQSRIGMPALSKIKPDKRNCARCGKEFLIGGAGNKSRKVKFCSRGCALIDRWKDRPGHEQARVMTDVEAAWFAGVFDGEGCIVWPNRRAMNTVRLSVLNTSLDLLKEIQKVSGTGKIRDRSHYRRSPKHSDVWVWDCYGENARIVLRQIVGRLIVKREAAEVAVGLRPATEPPLTQRTKQTRAAKAMEALE